MLWLAVIASEERPIKQSKQEIMPFSIVVVQQEEASPQFYSWLHVSGDGQSKSDMPYIESGNNGHALRLAYSWYVTEIRVGLACYIQRIASVQCSAWATRGCNFRSKFG